ncbi:MAG TPA: aspartate kinase [Phototrophicaceae bacterium]|nr:aspartate kinase [Phototrophicaceae bacterium]
MKTLVMKFGGSSVGTKTALTQVLSIVLHEREQWDSLILVVSALDGVTDALIEAAHLAHLGNQRGYRRIIANLRTRHMALIEELPIGTTERTALQADIDRLLFDMLDIYAAMSNTPAEIPVPDLIDATIGVGEKLAARIVAALLRQKEVRSVALDTTDLVITNEVFGNATPDITLTCERIEKNLLPSLDRGIVPVVTGFIGMTKTGKPTTLGRGGSDYTASILAICANAEEVWIWTGVDGMMSADPREINEALVISRMSYEEVAELAYFGARVLHARMIGPLRERHIPLRIKNVFKPQLPGTLIHDALPEPSHNLKAVTSIAGLALTSASNGPLAAISTLVDKTLFANTHTHTDVMISSQSATHSLVCFLIPTSAGPDAVHSARLMLEEDLRRHPEMGDWNVKPVSLITVIRDRIDESPTLTAGIIQCLTGIRILALALGPSHCSVSLVIDPEHTERVLLTIHDLIINSV